MVTLQQDNLPDKQNIQPTWKISLSDNTHLAYSEIIIATNLFRVYRLLKDNKEINIEFLKQLEKINRPVKVVTLNLVLTSLNNLDVHGVYGPDTPLYIATIYICQIID